MNDVLVFQPMRLAFRECAQQSVHRRWGLYGTPKQFSTLGVSL